MGNSRPIDRGAVLLDVSNEAAVALVELDRVKDAVVGVEVPDVLERLERAEDALRRLQRHVLSALESD